MGPELLIGTETSCDGIPFPGRARMAIAIVSSVLLLLQLPTLRIGILLAVAIWASCRAYYFVFYVIQRYVDPGFRFSGLWSFIAYALRKRRRS